MLLLACSGASTDDLVAVVDTAEYHYDGPTSIDEVEVGCTPPTRVVEVRTVGWSQLQLLRVVSAGDDSAFEFDPIPEAWDPDGAWQISVLEVASDCLDEETTFHLVVTDADGEDADCRVWGFDPDRLETDCSSL